MMKRILTAIVAVLFLVGCKKTENFDTTGYRNEAVIVGFYEIDECTGGYALNILDDSNYSKMLFTLELPKDTDINTSSIFPVKVAINWVMDYDYCPDNLYIKIYSIKKM